jgi:hypothetical protein
MVNGVRFHSVRDDESMQVHRDGPRGLTSFFFTCMYFNVNAPTGHRLIYHGGASACVTRLGAAHCCIRLSGCGKKNKASRVGNGVLEEGKIESRFSLWSLKLSRSPAEAY